MYSPPGTHTDTLDHFLVTFRTRAAHLQDKVDVEAASLSPFSRAEALALALTDDEWDQLCAVNLFAAAPDLLDVLNDVAALLPLAARLNPRDLDELQARVIAAISKAKGLK